MISKNDFVMVNWGNWVNKADPKDVVTPAKIKAAITAFADAYDLIKQLAPPPSGQIIAPGPTRLATVDN